MIISIIRKINLRFFKPHNTLLGRWNLKHDPKECEKYITNYYGEPGYQNSFKPIWIEKISKLENKS